MIKPYEGMFILRPDLSEEALKKLIGQVEEAIAKAGGKAELSQSWGRRRLAYPIGKFKEGHYHLVAFTCPSLAVDQLKHAYQLNEQIVRTMILSIEQIPAAPPLPTEAVAAAAPAAVPAARE